jgi:hypothetical protein
MCNLCEYVEVRCTSGGVRVYVEGEGLRMEQSGSDKRKSIGGDDVARAVTRMPRQGSLARRSTSEPDFGTRARANLLLLFSLLQDLHKAAERVGETYYV